MVLAIINVWLKMFDFYEWLLLYFVISTATYVVMSITDNMSC